MGMALLLALISPTWGMFAPPPPLFFPMSIGNSLASLMSVPRHCPKEADVIL
jgi:hypothetical protein